MTQDSLRRGGGYFGQSMVNISYQLKPHHHLKLQKRGNRVCLWFLNSREDLESRFIVQFLSRSQVSFFLQILCKTLFSFYYIVTILIRSNLISDQRRTYSTLFLSHLSLVHFVSRFAIFICSQFLLILGKEVNMDHDYNDVAAFLQIEDPEPQVNIISIYIPITNRAIQHSLDSIGFFLTIHHHWLDSTVSRSCRNKRSVSYPCLSLTCTISISGNIPISISSLPSKSFHFSKDKCWYMIINFSQEQPPPPPRQSSSSSFVAGVFQDLHNLDRSLESKNTVFTPYQSSSQFGSNETIGTSHETRNMNNTQLQHGYSQSQVMFSFAQKFPSFKGQ